MLLDDRKRKAQVRHIPKTFYAGHKDVFDIDLVEKMIKDVTFTKVYNKHGKLIRSSAWYTADPCNCTYVYAGQPWKPLPFVSWMYDVAAKIKAMLCFEDELNSINFNRYDDFSQSLGFHSDKEQLFQKNDGTANIISLSFGATRTFAFRKHFETDDKAQTVRLASGDILSMQGRMQQHYKHSILEDTPDGTIWKKK